MKEGHWTSWIPQGRPKEECSCEYIYPSKKAMATKEAPKVSGLPLIPRAQKTQVQGEAQSPTRFQMAGQSSQ